MTARQRSYLAAVLTTFGGLALAWLCLPADLLQAQPTTPPPELAAPTEPPPLRDTHPLAAPLVPVPASPTAVPQPRFAPPSEPSERLVPPPAETPPPAPLRPVPAVEAAPPPPTPIPTVPPPSEVVPAGQTAPAPAAPPALPPPVRLAPLPQMPSAPAPPPPPAAPPGSMNPQDPPTPAVSLQVRVPATVTAGKELEYHLYVRNLSTAAAHHVRVRDRLPANAAFVHATPEPTSRTPDLVWELGTLEGGASRDIVIILQPDGSAEVKTCAHVQFEHGQCVSTQITRPNLFVQMFGPSQANVNDPLTYRIDVRNSGGAAAEAVVLLASLPEGLESVGLKNPLTWDLGTVAAGQTVSKEYQALARKTGSLCSLGKATAAGGLHAECQSCVTVGEPKLQIEVKGPERGLVNRPATILLTVSNPGNGTASNVVVESPLPPRATALSVSDGGGMAGNQVKWLLGPLKASERRTLQLIVNVPEAGDVAYQATAAADRIDPVKAEVKTHFTAVTGLTAEVVVKDNPVEVGTPTSYLVTIHNQGDAPATRVGVVCQVPEQVAITNAHGQTGHRVEGQRVTFEALASLPPRGQASYEIAVLPRDPGDGRFQVELTADQLSTEAGPVRRQQSITIYGKRATPQLQTPQNVTQPPPPQ